MLLTRGFDVYMFPTNIILQVFIITWCRQLILWQLIIQHFGTMRLLLKANLFALWQLTYISYLFVSILIFILHLFLQSTVNIILKILCWKHKVMLFLKEYNCKVPFGRAYFWYKSYFATKVKYKGFSKKVKVVWQFELIWSFKVSDQN